MLCTESHAHMFVFIYALVLRGAYAEHEGVGAEFVPEGNHQEHYKERLITSLPDLNEIDDGIDQWTERKNTIYDGIDQHKRRERKTTISPEILKSEGQCSLMDSVHLRRKCLCNKPTKRCVSINDSHGTVKSTIPECVMVERCDGCCAYPKSCMPKEREIIAVPVTFLGLTASNSPFNSAQLSPECRMIDIEKHLKCGCACGMTPKECLPKKVLNSATCRCVCQNPEKADDCKRQNKSWDPELCECICPLSIPQRCSTGAFFHKAQCKCVPIDPENAWRASKRRRPASFPRNIP